MRLDDEAALLRGPHFNSNIPVSKYYCSTWIPGPACVRNIILSELCERFSYYGLRAILVLYFKNRLDFGESEAIAMFSFTASLAYFSPLIGGVISDSCLGKYRTIIYFSLIYIIGGTVLAISAFPRQAIGWLAFFGLFLIALGTGGIKPCVSAFGADQFPAEKKQNIGTYFAIFYMSINIGSVGSFIITPIIREQFGFGFAFILPAILLSIATYVVWRARNDYIIRQPSGSPLNEFINILYAAYKHRSTNNNNRQINNASQQPNYNASIARNTTTTGTSIPPSTPPDDGNEVDHHHHWIDTARVDGYSNEQIRSAKAVWKIFPIFSLLPLFWTLFDQQGSSWTLQASRMNLHGLLPEQMGVVNPLLIIILIPVFEKYAFKWFRRYICIPTPLKRMTVGMLVASLAFIISGILESSIVSLESNGDFQSVNILFQLPQLILISISEILVSVTGLEFAYSQSPLTMKGTVMSLFLITTSIGDLFAGVVYSAVNVFNLTQSQVYFGFALMMLFNTFCFYRIASNYPNGGLNAIDSYTENEECLVNNIATSNELTISDRGARLESRSCSSTSSTANIQADYTVMAETLT